MNAGNKKFVKWRGWQYLTQKERVSSSLGNHWELTLEHITLIPFYGSTDLKLEITMQTVYSELLHNRGHNTSPDNS